MTKIKALVIAETGGGKTHYLGTYPDVFDIITEPGGETTLENKPALWKNIREIRHAIPSPVLDVKDVFSNIELYTTEAHKLFADDKIKTLGLDNATYLMKNRWEYIRKYQKQVSSKTGQEDTRSMYGELRRWAYWFFLRNMISFPGNVVVTVHIAQEDEEAMAKKPASMKQYDVVANILGGFRDEIGGLFDIVMYLDKIVKQGKTQYLARVNKGNGKLAKNRFNLPDIIENISYQTILEQIEKQKRAINGKEK